jgi:hypothetical protein
VALSESVKSHIKQQTLKEPEFAQLDKVLCKWFTAVHSEGSPMTGPMIVEKAKFFNDCVKITGKCHALSVRAVT